MTFHTLRHVQTLKKKRLIPSGCVPGAMLDLVGVFLVFLFFVFSWIFLSHAPR